MGAAKDAEHSRPERSLGGNGGSILGIAAPAEEFSEVGTGALATRKGI